MQTWIMKKWGFKVGARLTGVQSNKLHFVCRSERGTNKRLHIKQIPLASRMVEFAMGLPNWRGFLCFKFWFQEAWRNTLIPPQKFDNSIKDKPRTNKTDYLNRIRQCGSNYSNSLKKHDGNMQNSTKICRSFWIVIVSCILNYQQEPVNWTNYSTKYED